MARRSISRSTSADPARPGVIVGRVGAPHGVRGEVRVAPRTDVADRFREGAELECDGVGMVTIASLRGTPARPIVRFEGYEDRTAAERLRQRCLRVSRQEARRAAGRGHLWDDLLGMRVERPDGELLGAVVDIIRAGETDVLVVRGDRSELLLPALESGVRSVDIEARRIGAVPQEELT